MRQCRVHETAYAGESVLMIVLVPVIILRYFVQVVHAVDCIACALEATITQTFELDENVVQMLTEVRAARQRFCRIPALWSAALFERVFQSRTFCCGCDSYGDGNFTACVRIDVIQRNELLFISRQMMCMI